MWYPKEFDKSCMDYGGLTRLSSSFASWKAFSLAALAISLPLCRSYSQNITAEAVCTGKVMGGQGCTMGVSTVLQNAHQPDGCAIT